jgi:hypothetical protein
MLADIAQQQRSGVDELGGRRLSAVRECFQPAAFFFGEGNFISGCQAPSFANGRAQSICEM